MINTKDKTLGDHVTKSTRKLFHILSVPDNFLETGPETASKNEMFKIALYVICSLATSNNNAKKGVALIQQMTRSGCFKSQEQLQYALLTVEHSQANVLNMKKFILMQQ